MMGKKVLILGVAAVQMDAVSQLKKMGCETFTCAMAKDGLMDIDIDTIGCLHL